MKASTGRTMLPGFALALIDAAPVAFIAIDVDGVIREWNRRAETTLGWPCAEAVGRTLAETIVPPQYREAYERGLAHFVATGEGRAVNEPFEITALRRDGDELPVEVTIVPFRVGATLLLGSFLRDLTERKRAEARVQERDTRLDAANKDLEVFCYSVSHDLRAPLRAIDGFARMLVENHERDLDAEARRLLGIICDNAQILARLIDDLLRLSRLGRQDRETSTIDMAALARAVVSEARAFEPTRSVTVTIGPLTPARGDISMIRQVLANLVSNALKFTRDRPDALIEIGGTREVAEQIYFVKDNGAGFDMQHASKLFGVFQRLHRPTEFEGTGIGLAIVRRIIARHRGRVWAEGKVDGGATFYFTLPIQDEPYAGTIPEGRNSDHSFNSRH